MIFLYLCGFLIFPWVKAYDLHYEVGLFYKYHKDTKTWFEAKTICESENAILAMPNDLKEFELLLKISDKETNAIHLGFHNFYSTHSYISLEDKALQYYFNTWGVGDPNQGLQHCLTIWPFSKGRLLADVPCDYKASFICQKKDKSYQEKHMTKNLDCSTEDKEYRFADGTGKCFKIHMNALDFGSADRVCHGEGGNLAIIRNKVEEIFLKNMFNEPKYTATYTSWKNLAAVGVHNFFEVKLYTTVLNEKLDYANWAPGRPDNSSNHRCVAMNREGQLDDYPCNESTFFICEISVNNRNAKQDITSSQASIDTLKIMPNYTIYNSNIYHIYNINSDEKHNDGFIKP